METMTGKLKSLEQEMTSERSTMQGKMTDAIGGLTGQQEALRKEFSLYKHYTAEELKVHEAIASSLKTQVASLQEEIR